MPIVTTERLGKTYRVAKREPGVWATVRHFVHRTFTDIQAVRDVSFSIEPGEVVGFLGPNGAGKTTTLKMLTGLIHPTTGQVLVAGHTPFSRHRDFLQQITLVMGQKQQLLWDLPANDSLRINAAIYEVSDTELHQRVGKLAEMLSVTDKLTQPVRKLSLGERMKVELLAALIHRPTVLFLDEPTLGLDVNAQAAVRQFIRDYNQEHNATVLLTSHYMADITALCNRVLIIHQGSLMYDGGLQQMLQRLAPHRELKLELREPADPLRPALVGYGAIAEINGRSVRLLVDRDALTATVARVLAELAVVDLTVSDPPVEDVIAQLFANKLEPAAAVSAA